MARSPIESPFPRVRGFLGRCTAAAILAAGLGLAVGPSAALRGAVPAKPIADFADKHCSSCHNEADKEGGLDLTSL
ncbi:MAG: hypothetical protein ABIZ81_06170, partial [Opitutaceae bacterium]